jgi:competence protein ComEA
MDRPPVMETRWFSLSRRELLILALAVGAALLAGALTQGARMLWGGGKVAVTARTDVAPQPARLNVNTASDYELAMLPGIGPVTAAAIIEYRRTHGPFASLEDLQAVRGIGPKTIEAIRPHAMCAAVTAESNAEHPPSLSEPGLRRTGDAVTDN